MSDLGIYFGPKAIDVTEVKGKKLVNNLQIPLLGIAGNELEEKVPTEIKLVASFNDAFRRNRIEAKEACLCLSGKDLIIRTFEIPVLPKEELQGAVVFEAKKYIPFKIEELISDYQIELDKLSHTNTVLFMGIKKDAYDKYFSILNQLNIKVNSIEYSGFSVLRVLKLAGIGSSGVMGMLCLDSRVQDEINFIVLDNGFPLFSRDINLASAPEEESGESAGAVPLFSDKLKAEVRVSLDYYHRKFPAKPLKNIFVVSNPDWRQELEVVISDLGLSSKFIDVAKVFNKPLAFSSSFAKSYSAAVSRVVPTRIRLNLIESWERALKPVKTATGLGLESLLKSIKLDSRVIISAVLICAGVFIYGFFQTSPLKQDLKIVINKRVNAGGANAEASSETLDSIALDQEKTLESLSSLIKKQLYATEVLGVIPRVLPNGVWLTKFSLSHKDNSAELALEGMSYLGDSNNEYQAVNKFYNDLKEDPDFAKYFKSVNIISIDHAQFAQATVTTFLISCKAYREAK
ncbi:MAG: pilus assembly protein PilM [Candidatus Omnitrophota bacterium]